MFSGQLTERCTNLAATRALATFPTQSPGHPNVANPKRSRRLAHVLVFVDEENGGIERPPLRPGGGGVRPSVIQGIGTWSSF